MSPSKGSSSTSKSKGTVSGSKIKDEASNKDPHSSKGTHIPSSSSGYESVTANFPDGMQENFPLDPNRKYASWDDIRLASENTPVHKTTSDVSSRSARMIGVMMSNTTGEKKENRSRSRSRSISSGSSLARNMVQDVADMLEGEHSAVDSAVELSLSGEHSHSEHLLDAETELELARVEAELAGVKERVEELNEDFMEEPELNDDELKLSPKKEFEDAEAELTFRRLCESVGTRDAFLEETQQKSYMIEKSCSDSSEENGENIIRDRFKRLCQSVGTLPPHQEEVLVSGEKKGYSKPRNTPAKTESFFHNYGQKAEKLFGQKIDELSKIPNYGDKLLLEVKQRSVSDYTEYGNNGVSPTTVSPTTTGPVGGQPT